jgi:hypothetical protein
MKQGNKEVVLAAVAQDGCALQYASNELKNDKEVAGDDAHFDAEG